MIAWTRAEWDHLCGGCDRQIRRGHPMQLITIPGVTKKKLRCVMCAEGVPPADLPPLPDAPPAGGIQPSPLHRGERVHVAAPPPKPAKAALRQAASDVGDGFDWKSKASGD